MIVVDSHKGYEMLLRDPVDSKDVAAELVKLLPAAQPAVFLCGQGHNGKLGLALKAELEKLGVKTELFSTAKDLPAECVIIDCLWGTELTEDLNQDDMKLVEAVNDSGKRIISIDVPSGLNGEDGSLYGGCVKADITLTLKAPKAGLYLYPGSDYAGRIIVVSENSDIQGKMHVNEINDIKKIVPKRKAHSHKGSYGKVLLIGGSQGMSGACLLAAKAIMRLGAGMLTVMCHQEVLPVIANGLPEAMTIPFTEDDVKEVWEKVDLSRYTTIAIGPGLGRTSSTEYLVEEVLKTSLPCVVDADGLFYLQGRQNLLKREAMTVITPHSMEYQRIFGFNQKRLLKDLEEYSLQYPSLVLVYKCEHTLIAHKGEITINTTGNNAMAKGGSGDVLCGMTTAFIAQRADYDSVVAAVYLHSLAADEWIKTHSNYSLLASDLIEGADRILFAWQKENQI